MGRSLTRDGECFRAVLKYVFYMENNTSTNYTMYFGPYDTSGMAKALRTRWINENLRVSIANGNVIIKDRYEEVTDAWRRI